MSWASSVIPVGHGLNFRTIERVVCLLLVLGLGTALVASRLQVGALKTAAAKSEAAAMKAVAEAERRARAEENRLREQAQKVETAYEAKLQDRDRALAAALSRLRDGAVRPRQPAPAAPATCGDYDAPPAQLSLSDREFLVRLGDEADRAVEQLTACQAFVRTLVGTD